jgi:hypothetical protein
MTYEQFISRFEKQTKTARGVSVRCPAHEDRQASLSVSPSRDGGVLLKCFAGCETEDIVRAMGLEMKDLFAKELERPRLPSRSLKPPPSGEKPVVEKTYSYTDALGREIYQAVRLKPKSFRQRHKSGEEWVWSMDGVERVLYRMPEVVKASEVWIVEGEKDADNLAALGFCATTNVGGAGKWLDGYTDALAGKDVVICGDNDEPGQKHVRLVFDSVALKARTVRVVKIPGHKDVSDLIASSNGGATKAIKALVESAVPHVGGVRMPVYSMADLQPGYYRQVMLPEGMRVDLGVWLPSFRGRVRPLLPGEVILFVGDTGIGKTLILQNLLMSFPAMPKLMFELELPPEMMFERFFAIKSGSKCVEVEEEWRNRGMYPEKVVMDQFPNLYICPEPHLTVDQFEAIVAKAELKMGVKPVLVGLDYAQLFKGKGNQERYERMSDAAEGVKVVARATQTVIAMASQVDRGSSKNGSVGLHSAKDSGSLENSSGLVVACSRDKDDPTLLRMKVVKSTKGGAGLEILCNIDGARAKITERARGPL